MDAHLSKHVPLGSPPRPPPATTFCLDVETRPTVQEIVLPTVHNPWSGFPAQHLTLLNVLYGPDQALILRAGGPSKGTLTFVLNLTSSHWKFLEDVLLSTINPTIVSSNDPLTSRAMASPGSNVGQWHYYWSVVVKGVWAKLTCMARCTPQLSPDGSGPVDARPSTGDLANHISTLAVTFAKLSWPDSSIPNTFIPGSNESHVCAQEILQRFLQTHTASGCAVFPQEVTVFWLWYVLKQVRESYNARVSKARKKTEARTAGLDNALRGTRKLDTHDAMEIIESFKQEFQELGTGIQECIKQNIITLARNMEARLEELGKRVDKTDSTAVAAVRQLEKDSSAIQKDIVEQSKITQQLCEAIQVEMDNIGHWVQCMATNQGRPG
ncbi:hypothetical protein BGX38DRAFT_707576 [Terfezia claveryi]|nr:hypothetical protein BGX38DRAFT_707576 [Terfezia claveryi]